MYSIGDLDDLDNFTTKVYVFGHRYTFKDVLVAFDFCFKSFYALNVPYPRISAVLWYIVQKIAYNYDHSEDRTISSTPSNNFINTVKMQIPHFYK